MIKSIPKSTIDEVKYTCYDYLAKSVKAYFVFSMYRWHLPSLVPDILLSTEQVFLFTIDNIAKI